MRISKPVTIELDKLRKKYSLALILLHGSQVTGRLHPESDVDIAVIRNHTHYTHTTLRLSELIADLGNVLSTDRIDVADLTHADPLLLYAATQKATLLSGNPVELSALQLKAFHRYQNYLPYLKTERQFVVERLRTYVTA